MSPTTHWIDALAAGPYRWTMLGAIVLSATWWFLKSKRDPGLLPIYIGALGGAFLGAKVVYFFAEGWHDWPLADRWLRLATGKSVLGGLLGGYGGVELMKWLSGYRKSTGDLFAVIAPLGIALGRVGCWLQGCCQGRVMSRLRAQGAESPALAVVDRWPAALVELAFQLTMVVMFVGLRSRPYFRGRLFFLYLAAYGIFRFLHEFMRETPVLAAGLSGYQMTALITALLGGVMFIQRGRSSPTNTAGPGGGPG